MGCGGSNIKVNEFKQAQDLIDNKKRMIEALEVSNTAPTEEQKMLIVRYNIEIYEQIDALTKELKIKSTKDARNRLEVLVKTFNDLIIRWKNISKEEEEEVQLRFRNENE